MKKKASSDNLILNRRARFDYTLSDEIWAGIVLSGPEVRAVRDGHVSLKGAYVTVKNGELWLTNSSFTLKTGDKDQKTTDTSPRKLLIKKSELENFITSKDKGLTIVPLSMTTKTRFIKVQIALAKGKKLYDKRETIKRREQEREAGRLLKDRGLR